MQFDITVKFDQHACDNQIWQFYDVHDHLWKRIQYCLNLHCLETFHLTHFVQITVDSYGSLLVVHLTVEATWLFVHVSTFGFCVNSIFEKDYIAPAVIL